MAVMSARVRVWCVCVCVRECVRLIARQQAWAYTHTSKYHGSLRGSAPYPALTQIDAMEKAVAVGWLSWLSWLSWLAWVHNIAILMYDIE